jgi:hypothetical protein
LRPNAQESAGRHIVVLALVERVEGLPVIWHHDVPQLQRVFHQDLRVLELPEAPTGQDLWGELALDGFDDLLFFKEVVSLLANFDDQRTIRAS